MESSKSMKAKILSILRQAQGYVSGQELCERLGVSRTAVWKSMKKLEEEGYVIDGVNRKGYRLMESPDAITAQEIESYLRCDRAFRCDFYQTENCTGTEVQDEKDMFSEKRESVNPGLQFKVKYAPEVDSTNTWAKREAENGAPEGTVLVADMQTAGKGRRGRSWSSPSGHSIYMSLILRPDIMPDRASMLTLVAGLSAAQAIRGLTGLETWIKWPNDLVISDKKICGILTEMSLQMECINYVVVGIGINVNMTEFPEEIANKATSLCLEKGQTVRRAEVIAEVLSHFEKNYYRFLKTGDLSGLADDYNKVLVNRNREIRVMEPGNEYMGTTGGINEKGELMVTKEDGTEVAVYAGEVSVRGLYGYV